MNARKNIAIIDMSVKKTSPAGSCVLAEIQGLVEHHKIHVFTAEIEDTLRDKIIYHKVHLPAVPNLLRYFLFYHKVKQTIGQSIKNKEGFIFQTTQGQFSKSNIAYAHFCHKAYLQLHWRSVKVAGLRKAARYLNHQLNVWMEEKAFKNAEMIVVPSKGLAREIIQFYPATEKKIRTVPNPIDFNFFRKDELTRDIYRKKLNYTTEDLVIAFSALGDFERKGLGLLLESVSQLKRKNIKFKVLVIGGKQTEIDLFKANAKRADVEDVTTFVGFHEDIRPFLWSSDIFALPSIYETFSLVSAQAAASGLPLLVTHLNGVEDYLVDNNNGWLVERSVDSIAAKLEFVIREKENISTMGKNAALSVAKYDFPIFHQYWRNIYEQISA